MELSEVKDSFEHVAKKQKLSVSKSQQVIEQIGQKLEQALSGIQSGQGSENATDYKLILSELKAKAAESAPLLDGAQKELNIALTKYPKLLDKTFYPELSKICRDTVFDARTFNQIIASHFYHEGQFDIGDCFVKETEESEGDTSKTSVMCEIPDGQLIIKRLMNQEMCKILESMKLGNLELSLKWATDNQEKLEKNGSDILFKLHQLQYLWIVRNKGTGEGLKYARASLSPFATTHLSEISKLMGCLIFAGKLDSSPYSKFLSSVGSDKLIEEFKRQFCSLIGQSCKSPLNVTTLVGAKALPVLDKLMGVIKAKKEEWHTLESLPVPIDLDREFQFHSEFICPVGKIPATPTNPPMLLPCGHVLCSEAIAGSSRNSRPFKCPYCPVVVESKQCKQLYF